MLDLNIALELLRNILKEPTSERHRSVLVDHINNEWIGELVLECVKMFTYVLSPPLSLPLSLSLLSLSLAQLFLIVGFLPKENSLVLLDEYLDLALLNCAVSYLQGIELAVTRAAIYTTW